jgi:cysteinyl-tRNA synthetase
VTLELFNSLTNAKEEFRPLEPGVVKLYTCGPTVYDYAHIGNFRTFLAEDLLRRVLEARGYRVRQVMNITDVGHMTVDDLRDTGEDKMAVAARRFGGDPFRVSEFYADAFFADLRALNFREAESYPWATRTIPQMIRHVERLIETGHAYVVGGNVYFDVSTFPAYGRLSGNSVAALKAGARLEPNEEKRHPADFAVWKHDEKHIMKWPSPWGEGFPGWHLECSVMAMATLGEQIDIHAGGEDNRFPHHECEIAQTEAVTGRPFARFWFHVTHLMVEGEKMAKSSGNFFTLRDLTEKGYDPMAIRLALLSVQYRQPMNLTMDGLDEAAKNLERVRDLVGRLGPDAAGPDRPGVAEAVERARAAFDAALDDDLNTSRAKAALLSLVGEVNRIGPPLSPGDAGLVRSALGTMDEVLGVGLLEIGPEEGLDAEIEARIEERLEARRRKDFATADRIRDELAARGILLVDTPEGTTYKRR